MSTRELIEAAQAAFNSGRQMEAESLCRQALQEAPHAAEALYTLGAVHSDRGDESEAMRLYTQAICFSPEYPRPYLPLSKFFYAMGRIKDLEQLLRKWTAVDPEDPEAQHLRAAATGENIPQQCDERYIQNHFNRFAPVFDEILMRNLGYQGPRIIAAALQKHFPAPDTQIDVLDAGCGTGLCGALIRQRCRTLFGVDLAEKMVENARKRECYDELLVGEICAAMEARPESFDAIVSADVLIYFGSLERFMRSARNALRPGGLLIVTTESLPEDSTEQYRLGISGRYAHHRSYVEGVLGLAGLDVVEIRDEFIRAERGTRVMGHGVVARRSTGVA